MRREWLAYVIVAVLAIAAGVVIAGLPETDADDSLTITAPSAPTDTSDPAATTTENTPSTTEPTATTEVPTTATPPTSAVTTTAPPTTGVPTTSAPTTAPGPSIPDRADVAVVVANGNGLTGSAGRNAERLAEIGYENIRLRNGTQIVEFTTIYHAPGFEAAAARLAADLDLLPQFVAPLDQAPAVVDLPADVELLTYLGLDRP